MAKKQTYFGKIRSQEEAAGKILREPLPSVFLNEEQRKEYEEGRVLLIDKDLHWTSFDVVRKLRHIIKIKKVGHAGTLDPLASGLLIVCTGKFTKKINEFMAQEKEYVGEITLGATTPTYDLESQPENFLPVPEVAEEDLLRTTQLFIGDILQKPPIYSAIKKDGEALYELARRGDDVQLQPRPINISLFEVSKIADNKLTFKVKCSTGTYIRSLAHDFGKALGCGAYLAALRRTKIGEHDVSDALTIKNLVNKLLADQNG